MVPAITGIHDSGMEKSAATTGRNGRVEGARRFREEEGMEAAPGEQAGGFEIESADDFVLTQGATPLHVALLINVCCRTTLAMRAVRTIAGS
jgi:hypothetical protein